MNLTAGFHLAQLHGGFAYGLEDDGERAGDRIRIADGQWHPFPVLVYAQDHELAGLSGSGDAWGVYDHLIDAIRKHLFGKYLEHLILTLFLIAPQRHYNPKRI